MIQFQLPKLPYSYDALEPFIDGRTVEIHYTKHHQNYLNNLNKILEKYPDIAINKTIEMILKDVESLPQDIKQQIINQGGGYANHNLYWQILSPNGGGRPSGELLKKINSTFGDYEQFKNELINKTKSVFGSGYGWLVVNNDNKNLEIITTKNQDSPLSINKTPIIIIDVWEHAYYLNYQNLRLEYIKNIFNILNWDEIERLYSEALK